MAQCIVCDYVQSYLIQAVEVVLHAFDGNVLAILDALGFQHLAESAPTLLGNKPILCLQQQFMLMLGEAALSCCLVVEAQAEAEGRQIAIPEGMWAYCSYLQTLS